MLVTVNGQSIEVPDGSSVAVNNGVVTVNGGETSFTGVNKLVIEGNTGAITTRHASVEVRGSVAGNVDAGGSVTAGDITGSVDCGGSVTCLHVGGDIDCGGSVRCGSVRGSIDAGGSVRHG